MYCAYYLIPNINVANLYKIFNFVLVGLSGNLQVFIVQSLIGPLLAC